MAGSASMEGSDSSNSRLSGLPQLYGGERLLTSLFAFQEWYQAKLGLGIGTVPEAVAARYHILCAQKELGELLDEFPGWKEHKSHERGPPDRVKVATEAADVLVFLTNIMLHAGVGPILFETAIKATMEKNLARLETGENTPGEL